MLAFATPGIDPLQAAGLGVLQGIAEFLPISSSGHLVLGEHVLGLGGSEGGHTFNIVVHAGTLVAVLWIYRNDLIELVRDAVSRGPEAAAARSMIAAIAIATLPLALVLLDPLMAIVHRFEADPRLVGGAFWVTAALLGFTHKKTVPEGEEEGRHHPPALWMAGLIGLAQLVAVLPGISRSGATIAVALALGSTRSRAARFSFFISIPAILGATAKEALDVLDHPSAVEPLGLVVGFAVSAVVGLLSLRALLAILERFGLLPFVPYLLVAGAAAIFFA